jgi:L-fuconolactonase
VTSAFTVDAHHHFWDPSSAEYPWMTDEFAAIRRRFGPQDLGPLLAECGIDRTVLVQTRASLDETRELLAVAARTDFVAGVVGWVNLTASDITAQLRRLRSLPEGRWLIGIRHQVHDELDPLWLARSDVRRGLHAVEEAGLAYDLLVRTRELPSAVRIARDIPGLRLVLDHGAKPPIRTGDLRAWAEAMAPLGECGNVSCKLSGLITEADPQTWQPEDLVGCVRQIAGWFGDDRLIFGSDWPVCLLAGSYAEVLGALMYALGDVSPDTRAKILGANAARIYQLPLGA